MGILSQQDIVITSAGRTLYECAYQGRPGIVVPSIEHEGKTSAEYSRLTGGFDVKLWRDEESPNIILQSLREYTRDVSRRKAVFRASRKLVDGKGLKRVLSIVDV